MIQTVLAKLPSPVVLALLALSLVLARSAPARADTLSDLVEHADRVFRSKTSAAVMRMDVKTRSYERSYKMVMWDDSRGAKEKTLIKILGPASWRGFATLKLGSQLKLYDPKTNHVQAVGSSMLGDSWMGSHFSNDDLVKETRMSRDYTASLLSERQGSDAVGRPATLYRVKLLPKPTAPVAWGRIEFDISDSNGSVLPSVCRYFTHAGDVTPARTLTFSAPRELGGRVVPTVLEIRLTNKPGEYTRLTYEELRFDVAVPASKFTEQALR